MVVISVGIHDIGAITKFHWESGFAKDGPYNRPYALKKGPGDFLQLK